METFPNCIIALSCKSDVYGKKERKSEFGNWKERKIVIVSFNVKKVVFLCKE